MALIENNIVFVINIWDLPPEVDNVIYLNDNITYFFTDNFDLEGRRIVCGRNTVILGGSSENCSIFSNGLDALTPLISSQYSLPIRNITMSHGTALDLDAHGIADQAIDWFGVNFTNCANVGRIANYTNFIMTDCALLNSSNMEFDGNIGTVGFSQCIFSGDGGGTIISIPETLNLARRFRIIYSAFVVPNGTTGITASNSASIPIEGYILDTVNFSGSGTYLSGITETNDKALIINCKGIVNSASICNMYMKNNVTATDITSQNERVPMAGTTEANPIIQRFSHVQADNAMQYLSSITRTFIVQVSFTAKATSNNVLGFYIGVCRATNGVPNTINADTDRVSESEVYLTASGTRPDAAAIQALVQLNEGDKVYLIVQNKSAANDITVEFMNMVISES